MSIVRMTRPCHSCGQIDDHPRHRHADKSLPGGVALRHIDCCATDGCPTGDCPNTERASGGKRGPELVAHLAALRATRKG